MKINLKLKKSLTVCAYVLCSLLIIAVAVILFLNVSGKTVYIGGKTAMWVKTQSMEPAIPERSYILVKKADGIKISEGDIIVFRSDDPSIKGALNTHRVVEVIGDGSEFVTKGDNNLGNDKYTAKRYAVEGIYVKTLPVLTFIGRVLTSTLGITVVVLLILIMSVFIYMNDIAALFSKKDKESQDDKQALIDKLVNEEIEKLKSENKDTNDQEK